MTRLLLLASALQFLPLETPALASSCAGLPRERSAMCTPSQAEKDHAVALVRAALEARSAALQAAADRDILGERAQGADSDSPSDGLEDWDAARIYAEDRERLRNEAMDAALSYVTAIYGMTPRFYPGEIKGGPFAGEGVIPKPIFQDDTPLYIKHQDKDGVDHYFGYVPDPSSTVGGVTLADGTILVTLATLHQVIEQGHPRLLASTLFHESTHFHSLTTGAGWPGTAEEEANAYTDDISVAAILELRPNETRDLYRQRATARAAARDAQTVPVPNEGPFQDGWLAAQEGLAVIRQREMDLDGRLARQRQTRRLQREIEERQATAKREEKARSELVAFCRKACAEISDSGSLDSIFTPWLNWRNSYLLELPPAAVLDLMPYADRVECRTLLENQILVKRRSMDESQFSDLDPFWIAEIVKSSLKAHQAISPGVPRQQISAPAPHPPVDIVPVDREGPIPDAPHCRHQGDWCKNPNPKSRNAAP